MASVSTRASVSLGRQQGAALREALAQYVVRAPVSLRNLLLDEGATDTVIYRAPYSDFFKTDTKVFLAVGFLVEVLQHLPDSRCRLIRTYGLYSSRARGTWSRQPYLVRLAPERWKRDHQWCTSPARHATP